MSSFSSGRKYTSLIHSFSSSIRRLPQYAWICRSCRTRSPLAQISRASYSSASSASISKPARTRFAPSPTGYLHLGSLRTALFNYLIAKATGGQFILRIEDTDQKRTIPDSEAELSRNLKWAGLEWDEGPDIGGPFGPYRQSERTELYYTSAQKLLQSGHAYRCFCTAERLKTLADHRRKLGVATDYDRTCSHLSSEESDERASKGEAHVIRLKVPEQYPRFDDLVYGHVKVRPDKSKKANLLPSFEDPILMKSDGFPTYHLANVVDDHCMEITHVIRGTEWLPSTPKHLAIYRAFGWEPPKFAHVGLLVNIDGSKLSKRDGESGLTRNVATLRNVEGILPEALINFVALLGWSHREKSDVMTLPQLIEKFNINFTRGDTIVNFTKLEFLQRSHAEKAVQSNNPSTVPTLITSIKKSLQERPDYPSLEKDWETILSGRPKDTYINDILLADSGNYTTPKTFTTRNLYYFTSPSSELLTETLPTLNPLFHKTGRSNGISLLELTRVLDISKINESAEIVRYDGKVYSEEIGETKLLENEWSVPNIKAWMADSVARELERILKGGGGEEIRDTVRKGLTRLLHAYLRWAIVGGNSGAAVAVTMGLIGPGETRRRLERAELF